MKYLLAICIAFCFVDPAHAVNENLGYETNGGDAVCAEFLHILDKMTSTLERANLSPLQASVLKSILAKRSLIELESQAEVYLDGVPKDAINFPTLPKPKIIISHSAWARLTYRQKQQLVLHEILPVSGYKDHDYRLSDEMLQAVENADDWWV